ncbi:MAG: S-methyl-5-thioribose kinase [Alphaproteobacteria bacterium]
MTAQLKLSTPKGYEALTTDSVISYLSGSKNVSIRLGGKSSQWTSREVGDGNLNLVFIVKGLEDSVVVKQALPYVRLVGESWPLPLSRAHYEHMALIEQARWAEEFVPQVYEHDDIMALTVMEYLSPHIILRKGLIQGVKYPHMAEHLGKFLARTLYHTSVLYLSADEKKVKAGAFQTNTAMCKISEDLIFDEPYFAAPMNRHTSPQLDNIALQFQQDTELKIAVQEMKWRFINNAEAMVHGDLHTGSVMVTENDTCVIDPEFAFYGPIGFDTGAILANMFMAYFSQAGHDNDADYAGWILRQAENIWQVFVDEFVTLAARRGKEILRGDVLNPRLCDDVSRVQEAAIKNRLEIIWSDTLGFAGCKIIRRILGLAHVEDFESIKDSDIRAQCERKALDFARKLLVRRADFKNIADVTKAAA